MNPRIHPLAAFFTTLALVVAPARLRAEGGPAEARTLLLGGRYAEARESYARLAKRDSLAAAIGVARCQRAVGELDAAIETLRRSVEAHPRSAQARAELAVLEFERGHHAAAQEQVDAALALDPDQPAARFMAAELHRVAGRLDQANDAYRWLVRFYNREQEKIEDPEVLHWIGLAGAQYARWNRSSGQFHFLVNTLYPEALERDSRYWPAHLEAALLFIEKYNHAAATRELDQAAAINPHAAEIHAARGLIAFQRFDLDSARGAIDRALAIDPRLEAAHRLDADVRMVAFGPRASVDVLERARKLDPTDEETLGRLAAVYGAIDGLRDDPAGASPPVSASSRTRMGAVVAEAVRRNEHCGAFFAALAAALDLLQKYPYAAKYYQEARRRMPQLVAVPGQLGLVYMRLADEARAKQVLDEAFEIDPFNIRVKNSLEVLEVLEGYGTIETKHFLIRFDRARDSLLARYAARNLEEDVYPEVVKKLGYEPEGRSLFEIFSRAKGTSGHSWFSARMVGLPFIGTVGACAGKMVAIASPNDGGSRFNWARVLKHEFVHIVNLQQTDFSIPRWYTEALAVRHEGSAPPKAWDRVLARRVASDRLFDLDNINLGFVRPSSGEDWALAYCQAELYARYAAATYGEDALIRLIAAYADNLDTPAALERCCGVGKEAFEKGYRRYLDRIVAESKVREPGPQQDLQDATALERAAESKPRDAELLGQLARAHLREGRPYRAKEWALEALEVDPKQQLAAFVVAHVHLLEGNKALALEVLRGAFDAQAPHPEPLALLTSLELERKDHAEAERLALLGQERFPFDADWQAGLVVVYRETGQREKLAGLLAGRAERDADDLDTRIELAQLAVDRNDFEAAGRWALEAIHIDVTSPIAHATLARALAETRQYERSIEEYETAIGLEPQRLEWRLALAKAYVAAGRKDRARQVLARLLEQDGQYPEARALLDGLGR